MGISFDNRKVFSNPSNSGFFSGRALTLTNGRLTIKSHKNNKIYTL